MHCYIMPGRKVILPNVHPHVHDTDWIWTLCIGSHKKHVKQNTQPRPGLTGHSSNAKFNTELTEALHEHFQKLIEKVQPQANKQAREEWHHRHTLLLQFLLVLLLYLFCCLHILLFWLLLSCFQFVGVNEKKM